MRSWLLVVALTVVVLPAVGQDLLDEPVYTVHFDAPLGDVIKQLREEHGIHIMPDQVLQSTRVVIDLEDVTEVDLLEAICRQVGAIYERRSGHKPGTWRWELHVGEWDDDPRPQTRVGDYAVFVETVEARQDFRWGGPDAEGADRHRFHYSKHARSVSLGISVLGLTHFAEMARRWALLTEAEFDTGETWSAEEPQEGGLRRAMQVIGPLPEGARRITRISGVVTVFSDVQFATISFTPEEVGTTKAFAGAKVTLTKWQMEDDQLRVKVEVPRGYLLTGHPWLAATLLDAAGQSVGQRGGLSSGGHNDMRYMDWGFEGTEGRAASVRIEGYVRTEPLTEVPFVIEDIPLP